MVRIDGYFGYIYFDFLFLFCFYKFLPFSLEKTQIDLLLLPFETKMHKNDVTRKAANC